MSMSTATMPQVSKSKPIDFTNPVDGGCCRKRSGEGSEHQEGKANLIKLLVPLLEDEQE